MKFFVTVLCLTLCVAAQAGKRNSTPFITLKDYWTQHKGDSRIISGQSAKSGQFPWQAAVTIDLGGGSAAFCGGSLIDPGWVLTAGHCVDGGRGWTIKIGGIIRTGSEPGSIITSTPTGFTHENYDEWNLENDIALIKLSQPIELSDTIQAARLPARSEVGNPLENLKLTVSGWGKTSDSGSVASNLQFVELDTISNKKCQEVYGPSIHESTLCCVGHPEHSTCNGDSGGPLVRYDSDGKATQVGVVSFVHIDGCASGNPSGYVRTASYLDWINEKTGIPIRN